MVYRKIQRKSRCLDVNGGFKKNGTPVIMWPCHSGPNQKFAYNRKTHQLRNKMTRKCVDYKKGRLVQNTCSARSKSQKWRKTKRGYVSVSNPKIRI
jgi:hypothetical protein